MCSPTYEATMPITKDWIIENAGLLAQLYNCAESIKNANDSGAQVTELTITEDELIHFGEMDISDFDLNLFDFAGDDEGAYSVPKEISEAGTSSSGSSRNKAQYDTPRPIKAPGYTGKQVIWPYPRRECPPSPRESGESEHTSTYGRRPPCPSPASTSVSPPSPATAQEDIRHSITNILNQRVDHGAWTRGSGSTASSSNGSSTPIALSNYTSREGSVTPSQMAPSPSITNPTEKTVRPKNKKTKSASEKKTVTHTVQVHAEPLVREDTPIPPPLAPQDTTHGEATRMTRSADRPANIQESVSQDNAAGQLSEYWTTPGIRMAIPSEPPTGYLTAYASTPSLTPYQAPYYCSDILQLPPIREIPVLRLPSPQPAYATQNYGQPTYECCLWDCWRFNPR